MSTIKLTLHLTLGWTKLGTVQFLGVLYVVSSSILYLHIQIHLDLPNEQQCTSTKKPVAKLNMFIIYKHFLITNTFIQWTTLYKEPVFPKDKTPACFSDISLRSLSLLLQYIAYYHTAGRADWSKMVL